ncbi:Stk1 family PASTA domain-containing Ser/Thr kinase [Bifidobacterium sp. B4081]|uniref:Stk1 family PASTA domain-containing Ser/Thr kinase n=1 Tax=unclassified Bifidobacterium TaxID=2608897 RepID=UPI002269FB7F|nr:MULTISPECIES: Stk1 family PASTA domain-containing Ser/Thr kinase [unclassified Bifidobacterium]MCX8644778.1 Stk1 family PASTA domain-containing Ser/Thr kinase [Bifidobacterium sp. B4077]MCX8646592.1 Stk1 family PASTA domain-containing Ser/Thr kinase [Bifidobacterium sp. B4081]MCX8668297.1 Stk1 family PASTA domain-containing Ser/Thr kinase [Bifidobacterium sp. B3998]
MSITLPPSLADGRYRLGQLIGRGGMAEVHKAVDTRLGRTVAVKIMRSDLANDEVFLSRFRREAHSVALLNNPNIVSIYDSGEEILTDDQGNHERVPYLVMEYVKGQTLRSILKENGALSQRDSEQVMLGMLSALDYSHHMGVIHRDIKPGNIMISEQGIVKVMDFGIARAMDDSAATMTQSQGVVGTAQYLSPEQARGESVDMRSDLYSAGCVLYEMLTGRPPFNGDSAVAIAYQHVTEVATPPSSIVPGLPKMWDSICAKAMAKDRQNRYATASAFKSDILAFMNGGTPVAAAFNPLTDLANVKARKDAEQGAETATMPLTEEETAATQAFNPVQDSLNPAATGVATAERTAAKTAQQKAKKRKKIIIGAVLGALLLVAAGLGLWTVVNRNHHQMAEVPTINAQMSRILAREKVTAAGFHYQEKEDHDSAEPKGTFTKQSPKGGSMAPRGSTVTVWFSSGPKDTAIPDVKGMNQQEARRTLEKAGFKVSPAASVEDSQDVPKDHVTRTDPAAGQSVAKGTSILIYISSGMTKVPDLSGKSKDDATKTLQSLHFNITIREQASNSVAKDMVISTDPAAGSSVQQGAMITVTVSNGMQLGNYIGMTLGEAKRTLGQGVNIKVNGPNNDNAEVTGQDPAAGASFDKSKDTITLTTAIRIPPFSQGETLGSYRQKLTNSGVSADRVTSIGKDTDKVTAVNPAAGSRVDDNTPITVTTISSTN